MQVTYNSGNPVDQWRCQLYCIYSRPNQLTVFIGLPLLIGAGFAGHLIATNWREFLEIEALALVGWLALLGLVFGLAIAEKTATRTRICTTTLTPEGFQDVTPNSSAFVPWENVVKIVCHNGDVYLQTATGGSFIPRCAFETVADAQAYSEAATAAKRGDYSQLVRPERTLESLAPCDDLAAVWPPPPSPIERSLPAPWYAPDSSDRQDS